MRAQTLILRIRTHQLKLALPPLILIPVSLQRPRPLMAHERPLRPIAGSPPLPHAVKPAPEPAHHPSGKEKLRIISQTLAPLIIRPPVILLITCPCNTHIAAHRPQLLPRQNNRTRSGQIRNGLGRITRTGQLRVSLRHHHSLRHMLSIKNTRAKLL